MCSYMLMMDDGQGGPLAKVHVGGSTSYKAMKLQPASRYRVAVQVCLYSHLCLGTSCMNFLVCK